MSGYQYSVFYHISWLKIFNSLSRGENIMNHAILTLKCEQAELSNES